MRPPKTVSMVPVGPATSDPRVPFQPQVALGGEPNEEPQTATEAEARGPDEEWVYWQNEITIALQHEKRWRAEALKAEEDWFGSDDQTALVASVIQDREGSPEVSGLTQVIHATIETMKPLIYSAKPQPIVRRRFRGDGQGETEIERMAAEVAQRLAAYHIDESGLHQAMQLSRDDWLVSGRARARVLYRADVQNGVKRNEEIVASHWPWRRVVFAPADSYRECRWTAYETMMTRAQVERHPRMGPDVAAQLNYDRDPTDSYTGRQDRDADMVSITDQMEESGDRAPRTKPYASVMEIWDRERRKIVWWAPGRYKRMLGEMDDPLKLKGFYDGPAPLLASTKGGRLTPRPDIAYYRKHAEEIEVASQKLRNILESISVSGLYAGEQQELVKELLNGKNTITAVRNIRMLRETGGGSALAGMLEWLPIDLFLKAAEALLALRNAANLMMYEISGIGDIIRGQGDPNETATAQQIKGRYANLRLTDRQMRMSEFALGMIRIMVELSVELFDVETVAAITGLNLPLTAQERDLMLAEAMVEDEMNGTTKARHLPRASWEEVLKLLRDDKQRQYIITIESESTILADETEDKEARIEFLTAFAGMVERMMPLAQMGAFDMRTAKELLLFGVRGFRSARTLEGMIESLPDEVETQPPEDTQIAVAKIRAEIDNLKIEADAAEADKQRQHEKVLAGVQVQQDVAKRVEEHNQREADREQRSAEGGQEDAGR